MKKAACLILIMTVLACAHVSALADMGYVGVKTILNGTMENGFSSTLDEIPDDSTVLVYFNGDDYSVTLFGKNSRNEYEGTIWELESTEDFVACFLVLCSNWDDLEGWMRPGYQFQIAYTSGDTFLTIDSSSEAEIVVAVFYDALGLEP